MKNLAQLRDRQGFFACCVLQIKFSGKFDEGLKFAQDSVRLTENYFGPEDATLASPLIRLGVVLKQILS